MARRPRQARNFGKDLGFVGMILFLVAMCLVPIGLGHLGHALFFSKGDARRTPAAPPASPEPRDQPIPQRPGPAPLRR